MAAAVSLKAVCSGIAASSIHLSIIPEIFGCLEDSALYAAVGLLVILAISKAKDGRSQSNNSITDFQIGIRAFLLGWGFNCGLYMIITNDRVPLGAYICLLSTFHYTEFLVTSFISPETLSLDSFLLNHSKEYGIAAAASVTEFLFEWHFIPWLKHWRWLTYIGLALCVSGEIIRKLSMLTASKNFTHLIRERKAQGQYLVTTGPYAICRHPGYAGWFWWSIGTQLVMVNPICFIGYCFAVHRFFKSRIYYEEICLLTFFGLDYVAYQKKVCRTGVPYVEGYLHHTAATSSPDEYNANENTENDLEDDESDSS